MLPLLPSAETAGRDGRDSPVGFGGGAGTRRGWPPCVGGRLTPSVILRRSPAAVLIPGIMFGSGLALQVCAELVFLPTRRNGAWPDRAKDRR